MQKSFTTSTTLQKNDSIRRQKGVQSLSRVQHMTATATFSVHLLYHKLPYQISVNHSRLVFTVFKINIAAIW